MKKDIVLYNVIFPLWIIMLFPQMWLIVLAGNYIIDTLVLVVCMFCLKFENKKNFYKNTIFKIFGFGILSDLIGSAYMLVIVLGLQLDIMCDEPGLTVPALVISAICIFVFNYFITFRKNDKKNRLILALVFAIVTAPYTFLIPLDWLY